MTEKKKKTLKQKMIEVSKSIGYLQKDKKNKMQGYSYLSEARIKEVIKKQFEEQGIVFNYSTEFVREYEISPTKRGTKQFCTVVSGDYNFMDAGSDEIISGSWVGTGSDTSDKGLYKAITGGIKYVLNTNFLIPTGDDPEDDSDKTTPKSIDPDTEYDHALLNAFSNPESKTAKAFVKSIENLSLEEQIQRLKAKAGN